MVVEFLVLRLGDVLPGPCPQRRGGVERGRIFAAEDDRQGDVIGVGLDDALEPRLLQELVLAPPELEGNGRTAARAAALGDSEAAQPVRHPGPGLFLTGLAALDGDLAGDHEGGVEADAELPDQAHPVRPGFVLGHLLEEAGGAGAGDGAEIGDELVAIHADAVVTHAERPGLRIDRDTDAELGLVGDELGAGEREIAQAVAGVRGVGDELAQEDLLLAVERVGDDMQQLGDLGLEIMSFFGHRWGSGLGNVGNGAAHPAPAPAPICIGSLGASSQAPAAPVSFLRCPGKRAS